jgi:SDR family mycofactocin-dependent oxidoreductase
MLTQYHGLHGRLVEAGHQEVAMTGRMAGKVALVTGAARGQGRSHAVRLAEEGADIIALDLAEQIESVPYPMATRDDLAETTELVERLDRRIVARVADVRELSQVTGVVQEGIAELGRLDAVVANAGISPVGKGVAPIAWLDTVQVNLVGVVNTITAAYPHLGPGASIVCTGSMAALMPGALDITTTGAGAAGYSHAKRAVARLVHDLALALAPQSIRVNAVHPGNIDTPMLQNDAMYRIFRPDLENPTRADATPAFGRMHKLPVDVIDPRDISEAVLFLASDAARYITGQQLKVDAGALLTTTTSGAPA